MCFIVNEQLKDFQEIENLNSEKHCLEELTDVPFKQVEKEEELH